MAESSTRIEPIIGLENPNFSFTPISKRGKTKEEAISVEDYTQIRSFSGGFTDLDEDEIMEIKPCRSVKPKKERKPIIGVGVIEIGESSFDCSGSQHNGHLRDSLPVTTGQRLKIAEINSSIWKTQAEENLSFSLGKNNFFRRQMENHLLPYMLQMYAGMETPPSLSNMPN